MKGKEDKKRAHIINVFLSSKISIRFFFYKFGNLGYMLERSKRKEEKNEDLSNQ